MKTQLEVFQKERSINILSEQYKQSQHLNDEAQIIKQKKTQLLNLQQSSISHLNKRSVNQLPQSLILKLFTKDLFREGSFSHSPSLKNMSKNIHLGWEMGDLDSKKLSLQSTESESSESTLLV